MMRGNNSMEVRDALSVGVDQNGGFTVPDEFEHQLIQALEENNIFRTLAKTIHTNSGQDHPHQFRHPHDPDRDRFRHRILDRGRRCHSGI